MTARPCLTCGRLTTGASRHAECVHVAERLRDLRRGSRAARGYGQAHLRARAELEALLPMPCLYEGADPLCPGTMVGMGDRWVAAHVADGLPEYGWAVAHPACNERAKHRRGTEGGRPTTGPEAGRTPAPSVPHTYKPGPP